MPFGDFEVGRVYNRRRDIHARFGGQQLTDRLVTALREAGLLKSDER
jgi:hypothetical protein